MGIGGVDSVRKVDIENRVVTLDRKESEKKWRIYCHYDHYDRSYINDLVIFET